MKKTIDLFLFVSIIALLSSVSAEITVTDADAIREVDLSSVSIPTNPQPVSTIFTFNENAVLMENLSGASIPTVPTPIQEIFVVNEQASLLKGFDPGSVPTAISPIEKIFVINEQAKAYAEFIYPVEMMEDINPPVITNVTAVNITDSSAVVVWDTNEFADSLVEYGISPDTYTEQEFDELFAKNHNVTLADLSIDTRYYFVVKSTDRSGNTGISAESYFNTGNTTMV